MGAILGLVGGIRGAALLAALLALAGWGWMQHSTAVDERGRADQLAADKALVTERLSQVAVLANDNAAEAEQARADAASREQQLAAARRADARIREEFAQRAEALQEATRDASPEYQACMRLPVPAGVLDALGVRRGRAGDSPGGGDEDPDGVRNAAAGRDAPVSDPGSS